MGNPNQPFDGPNNEFNICGKCGNRFGTLPQGGIDMWNGTCDICGQKNYLSNALHDWDIDADTAQAAIAILKAESKT